MSLFPPYQWSLIIEKKAIFLDIYHLQHKREVALVSAFLIAGSLAMVDREAEMPCEDVIAES